VAAGRAASPYLLVAAAPVAGTAVLSDWSIHRLRSQALTALGAATRTQEFADTARGVLGRITQLYAASAVGVGALLLIAASVMSPGSIPLQLVLDTLAYAALAVALFVGTLLLSLRRPLPAAAVTSAAFAADCLLRAGLVRAGWPVLELGHVAVAVAACAVLLRCAAGHFTSPSSHR
jgi:hypothetical protein